MKSSGERLETKQHREQRKEILRLRRQIKEMKREIRFAEAETLEEEFDDVDPCTPPSKPPALACSKCCSTNTVTFPLGTRTYFRCEACGAKGRVAGKTL